MVPSRSRWAMWAGKALRMADFFPEGRPGVASGAGEVCSGPCCSAVAVSPSGRWFSGIFLPLSEQLGRKADLPGTFREPTHEQGMPDTTWGIDLRSLYSPM